MSKNKKFIFLDRDGVINKDPGGWTPHSYVTRWKEFRFIRGSKKAIKKLINIGYDIIIVSNQGGVSKGYFTEKDLDGVNERMLREIEKTGGGVKRAYYCVHHDIDECACRKPKIGLFKMAEKELGIKARGAYFIGDGRVDVEAGKKAGLKNILVLSGKTKLKDVGSWKVKPDFIFKDLSEAVSFILNKERK